MNTEAAIFKSLDKIEANFGDVKTNQAELADRVLQLEQSRSARSEGISAGSGESFGAMVQKKFRENEDSFRKHKVLSLDIEVKAINSLRPVPAARLRQPLDLTFWLRRSCFQSCA